MRVLALLMVIFVVACSEQKVEPVTSKLNNSLMADQVILNSKIKFSEAGKLKAIVFSDTLLKFNNKNETMLKNVHIDFYNQYGYKNSVLDSDKGIVNDRTKNMKATGNVIARNNEGVILKTEELSWINKTKKIKTDKFVKIITARDTTEGFGFEATQDLSEYKIFNPTYYSTTDNRNK